MRFPFLLGLLLLIGLPVSAIQVDDSPAEPESWGFRPLEGDPSDLNPPGFTWRPVKKGKSYDFQILGDSAGERVVYEAFDLPWSAHCPSTPLEEGIPHYWRYRVQSTTDEVSDWSIARTFTIGPGATVFPKPPAEEIAARVPEGHPRIFFNKDSLLNLRELAQGSLSDRWAKLKETADNLLDNPPDTSEPPLYPEGTVRLSDEWKKIWWGNRTHTIAVVDSAALLAFAYQITQDTQYGEAAKNLLLAFCDWDPEGSTEYEYNDEAAMPALYFPSRVYTWVHPLLSLEEREKVIEVMAKRGRQCFEHLRDRNHLWNPYASHSNRAWHFLGELSLAFYDDIPEAPMWLDYAMTIFYTCYPVWSDPQGGWHEGVAYWYSYMTRFGYWILAMDSAFGIDVFERPFFKKTGNYALYMVPPHTEHGAFADQASGKNLPEGAGTLMSILASGAGNPYWKWYAEQVDGDLPDTYYGFMWAAKAVDLEAKAPTDLPSSACFYGVGIASLNTNILDGRENVQVVFKSSPRGNISHGYNNNNAFHLNVWGEPLLVNTGRRDVHGSEHHRNWMWQTKSQNSILVGGEGQIAHNPASTGRIVDFKTSDTVDVVAGEASASYDTLNRYVRTLIFLKPNYVVVHDVLDATDPTTFDWLVHGTGEFALDTDHFPPIASRQGERGKVALDFIWPENLSLSQTDRYDPPPAEWTGWDLGEWHLSAKTGEPARRQTFVTVIRIEDASADYSHAMEGETSTLIFPGGAKVMLNPDGAHITSGEIDWEILYPAETQSL